MMSVLWLVLYGDDQGGVVERNGSICANNLHKQSPSLTTYTRYMYTARFILLHIWDSEGGQGMEILSWERGPGPGFQIMTGGHSKHSQTFFFMFVCSQNYTRHCNLSRLQLTRRSLHSIAKQEWHGCRCWPKRALQAMGRWIGPKV